MGTKSSIGVERRHSREEALAMRIVFEIEPWILTQQDGGLPLLV